MSKFSQKLNLANFTCRFGEKLVMLDLFDEVVAPAFTDAKQRRTFGDTAFSLLDPSLVKFADGELAFAGRLVKDTIVEREQIMVEGKIKKDYARLESAPTSFFVLLLSNHKLLYVKETKNAPAISQFEATMSLFVGAKYKEWIRGVYDDLDAKGKRETWKKLFERFPPPQLEITPMSTESSVSAYVEKFRTINSVEVRVLATNHELDNSPIFGEMRDIREEIQADQVLLRTHKAGEDGLDKGGVAKLISAQAEEGNAKITLKGKGINGDKLTAMNDSFNVAFEINQLPAAVLSAASRAYEKIKSQIGLGTITVKEAGQTAKKRIAQLVAEREWG